MPFDVIDPTEPIASIIVIISAAIAFLTTGIFGGSDTPAVVTPATASGPAWTPGTGVGGSASGSGSSASAPLGASATPDPGSPEPPSDIETYPGGGVGGGSAT